MAEQRISEEVRDDQKRLLSGGNGVGVKELGSSTSTSTGDEENEKDLKVSDDDMAPKSVPHQPMPRDKLKYVKEDAKIKRKDKKAESEVEYVTFQSSCHELKTNRNGLFAMTTMDVHHGQDEIVGGGEDGDSGGGGGGSMTQQVSTEAKTTRLLSLKSNSDPPKKSTGRSKLKKKGRRWK